MSSEAPHTWKRPTTPKSAFADYKQPYHSSETGECFLNVYIVAYSGWEYSGGDHLDIINIIGASYTSTIVADLRLHVDSSSPLR